MKIKLNIKKVGRLNKRRRNDGIRRSCENE